MNAPETTSAGRFLDAVAALLGICTERRYQGEPAMRLEATAARADPVDLPVPYADRDGRRVVDVGTLARELDERSQTHPAARIAATAQDALARGLATIAVDAAADRGVDVVGFTGGVSYNDAISRRVRTTVESAGVQYLAQERVPPGDAGISYGQALVATARR